MKFKLLLVLLVATFGCAPEPCIPLDAAVSISPSFSALETEAVLQAISDWHCQTGGKVALKATISDSLATLIIRPGFLTDLSGFTEINGSQAVIQLDSAVIATDTSLPIVGIEEEIHSTAMHEIGHALGLDHEDETLMRPIGYNGGVVDAKTLRHLTALRF